MEFVSEFVKYTDTISNKRNNYYETKDIGFKTDEGDYLLVESRKLAVIIPLEDRHKNEEGYGFVYGIIPRLHNFEAIFNDMEKFWKGYSIYIYDIGLSSPIYAENSFTPHHGVIIRIALGNYISKERRNKTWIFNDYDDIF